MRSRAFASLLLTGLTLTAVAQEQYRPLEVGRQPDKASSKPGKLPVWSAKPGATARLGPEQSLFGWAIRPPKGFVSTQKSENGNQVFIFQGDPRPDNSAPIMWVVTGDVHRAEKTKPPEQEILDLYMIQMHHNRDNWNATPAQYGTIQGRKYVRRRWSATETNDGVTRHVRGIIYLTVANAKYSALTLQDVDPGANTSVPLMETSAFTYHKR
ncbi:MAG: hypothetical protein JWL77_5022 [Chthonomonadaceae bacterium]|nr:hypothetical protein [Chthonomonadaceae bacterium]